ncbi:hypothetical protein SNEBB_005884 [Seison nebaliae]|nr:hypothetical protein SNEBB_005884 [Seison nebaliae]
MSQTMNMEMYHKGLPWKVWIRRFRHGCKAAGIGQEQIVSVLMSLITTETLVEYYEEWEDDDDTDIDTIITRLTEKLQPKEVPTMEIGGKTIRFQVDTGRKESVISGKLWCELNFPKLISEQSMEEKEPVKVNSQPLQRVGTARLESNQGKAINVHVLNGDVGPLLGRQDFEMFGVQMNVEVGKEEEKAPKKNLVQQPPNEDVDDSDEDIRIKFDDHEKSKINIVENPYKAGYCVMEVLATMQELNYKKEQESQNETTTATDDRETSEEMESDVWDMKLADASQQVDDEVDGEADKVHEHQRTEWSANVVEM